MTALWPYILAAGGTIIALFLAFIRGQSAGASKERAKQLQERQEARTIADEVDNDVGAMPPSEARKELSEWSKG